MNADVLEVECIMCGQPRALAKLDDPLRVCQRCEQLRRLTYDRGHAIHLIKLGRTTSQIAREVRCTTRTIRRLRKEIG